MTIEQQLTTIARDRQTYHITPVELYRMPGWMTQRVRSLIGHMPLTTLDTGPHRILDHWGTTPDGLFVTEPYGRYDDDRLWQAAKAIADKLGCDYDIQPAYHSWWYPGRTVRVVYMQTDY